jgi:hypothetical protein
MLFTLDTSIFSDLVSIMVTDVLALGALLFVAIMLAVRVWKNLLNHIMCVHMHPFSIVLGF